MLFLKTRTAKWDFINLFNHTNLGPVDPNVGRPGLRQGWRSATGAAIAVWAEGRILTKPEGAFRGEPEVELRLASFLRRYALHCFGN